MWKRAAVSPSGGLLLWLQGIPGVHNRGGGAPVFHPELVVHVVQMEFHRSLADSEPSCDFFVGEFILQQLDDLRFPPGERYVIAALAPRHGLREILDCCGRQPPMTWGLLFAGV